MKKIIYFILTIVMSLLMGSSSLMAQQGKTKSSVANFAISSKYFNTGGIKYDYAFNGTQFKIKVTEVTINWNPSTPMNGKIESKLRAQGIIFPFTQSGDKNIRFKYSGSFDLFNTHASGDLNSSTYDGGGGWGNYTFFEKTEQLEQQREAYYEKNKTNLFSDHADIKFLKVTDFEFHWLEQVIQKAIGEIEEEQQQAEKGTKPKEPQNTSSSVSNSNSLYSRTAQSSNTPSSTGSSGSYNDPARTAKQAETQQKNQEIKKMNDQIADIKAQQESVDRSMKKMDMGVGAMSSSFSSGATEAGGLLLGSRQFVEGVGEATGSVGATYAAGAFATAASIWSAASKNKAQKEAAAKAAAERREIEEQREAERKRREAELERLRKEAFDLLIRQRHTVIETFSKNEPIPLSTTHVEGDTIYYFIYAYNPVSFEKEQTMVYVSNLFAIARYRDGTWPYQSSIENEIKALAPYTHTEVMHGYYLDAATAQDMRRAFIGGFRGNEGVSIRDIVYREESMAAPHPGSHLTSDKKDNEGLGISIGKALKETSATPSKQEKQKESSLGIPIGPVPKTLSAEELPQKEKEENDLGVPIKM